MDYNGHLNEHISLIGSDVAAQDGSLRKRHGLGSDRRSASPHAALLFSGLNTAHWSLPSSPSLRGIGNDTATASLPT